MAITEFDGTGSHSYTDVAVRVRDVSADPTAMCADGTRLCQGILASNADCFHSSGVCLGPRLTRVELSSTFDDYLNIHSRTQVVSRRLSGNRLTILDPRLERDKGLPNDHPYGTAESFQNVRPGDTLSFYALNSLRPLALHVPVVSTARFTDKQEALAEAAAMNAELPKPPYSADPPVLAIDVCGLPGEPQCALRVPTLLRMRAHILQLPCLICV